VATYVLVHGAWHGPWVFDGLRAELAARGHESVAPELPVSDGSATWHTYADAIEASMAGSREPPVLVGHSLAGMAVPIVAGRVPVAALVFLGAIVPNLHGGQWEGNPEPTAPGSFQGFEERPDGSTFWVDAANAKYSFYQDWDEAEAHFHRLVPQNSSSLWVDPYPLTEWPDCPILAISMSEDRSIGPDYSRYVARERLGVEPLEFPGDHSPFLSQPAAFADFLVGATT
jgi:hypothetical protein